MYQTEYIMNKARCKLCGTIVESKHRHDLVWCECGEIAVDGGNDYHKGTAKNMENFIRIRKDSK